MITLRSAADLTVEATERVAFDGEPLTLDAGLLGSVERARAAMTAALGSGARVYGVNTGMGYLAATDLSPDEQRSHQHNLLLGRAVGSAPYLDASEARAVLVARLHNLLSGRAGVTAGLCTYLVARLNDGFTPAIPRGGSGSAGEIIPLAHAFQTFLGVGSVLAGGGGRGGEGSGRDGAGPRGADRDGSDAAGAQVWDVRDAAGAQGADRGVRDAGEALAELGVEPYRLEAKEGIALLAGAPVTVALGIARRRAVSTLLAQLVTAAACAVDALRAPLDPYDAAVAVLAGDPVLGGVHATIRSLLAGAPPPGRAGQAPVSFRVAGQVLAHVTRELDRLDADVRRALAAVSDSPAFVDGRFVTSGAFHEIGVAAGMDTLAVALIRAAELSAQRLHRLLDSRYSGLPDQLTPDPGPQSGLVVVHKRAVAAVNALRRLAPPASIGLADTSLGQEDAMTFGLEAADKLQRVVELVREVAACELLAARQAWALRGSCGAAGLRATADRLAEVVDPVLTDRPLGSDVTAVVGLLEHGELAARQHGTGQARTDSSESANTNTRTA